MVSAISAPYLSSPRLSYNNVTDPRFSEYLLRNHRDLTTLLVVGPYLELRRRRYRPSSEYDTLSPIGLLSHFRLPVLSDLDPNRVLRHLKVPRDSETDVTCTGRSQG